MKNTFVKVLSFVMALMMVVGTFSTLAVFADDHVHTKGTLVETKAPTCQKNGYSTYICGVEGCGAEWTTDLVLASAKYHNYEEKAAEDATCSSNAKPAATVCSHCGLTPDGQPRPETAGTKLDHVFVGKIIEATCDTDKKVVYSCKLCGKTAEELAKTDATIDLDKWGEKNEGGAVNKDHKNEKYLEWVVVTAPSQTATECLPGLAQQICTNCNVVVSEAEIPAIHTYVDLNEEELPCIEWEPGVLACSVCGEFHPSNADAEKRPTAGHDTEVKFADLSPNGKLDIDNLPTRKDGTTLTLAELADDYGLEIGDALKVDSTCVATGKELVRCECGHIYWAEIAKKNHTWKIDPATKLAYTVKNPEKCTDAKVRVWECSVEGCGHTETEIITAATATAHNWVLVPHDAENDNGEKSRPATCVAGGYEVYKCANELCTGGACGVEREKRNYTDALGHTYGAPYYAEDQAEGATCATGVWEKKCSVCEDVVTVTAANTAGWTAPECDWDSQKIDAATCHTYERKYTPCKVCDAEKDVTVGTAYDTSKHVYPTADELKAVANGGEFTDSITGWVSGSEKASTCTVAGTLIVECVYGCGASTIDYVEAPLKDHNYIACDSCEGDDHTHVYYNYVEGTGDDRVAKTGAKAPTCQATGYKNDGKVCSVCFHIEKAATVEAKTAASNIDGHTDKNPTILAEVDATCKAYAYTTYNFTCCGIVTVTGTEYADHDYTVAGESKEDNYVDYVAPSCVASGHHKYIACSVCNAVKAGTMVADITKCGCVDTTAEAWTSLSEAERDALTRAHEDKAANDDYIISAIPHDFKKVADGEKFGFLRETCDTAGRNAAYFCANGCGDYLYDGKYYDLNNSNADTAKAQEDALLLAIAIPAHYGRYTTKFAEKEPTCTERGISAEAAAKSWCTVCDVEDGVGKWLDLDPKPHTEITLPINLVKHDYLAPPADKASGEAFAQWLASLNVAGGEVVVVGAGANGISCAIQNFYALKDCTKDGALVTVCTACGASEAKYAYATNTEHKFGDYIADTITGSTCYADTTETRHCSAFGCEGHETRVKENGAATGHYTTKGVVNGEKFFFEYDCTKIDEYKEYSCEMCGTAYTDLLKEGVRDTNGELVPDTKIDVKHDVIDLKQDPTCTEDGYVIKECKNCVWIDSEKTPYGLADTENKILPNLGGHNKDHEKTIVLEDVAPTLEQDGRFVYVCGVCGETITEVIAASLAVDSVIAPEYAVYSSGNVVNAIVTITADEFSFNTLTIDVNSALKLVDFEMLAKFDVNTSAFINADGDVVIFAEDTLTGDFQNATFAGGEDVALIKLTFAISKLSAGEYTFATEINAAEIYNADEDKLEAVKLIDAAEDEKAKITVTVPGNFNGDNNIDARDLASFLPALANAVLTGEVENKYDLNNDGKVDFTDVAGLRAYIADGLSLKSYLAMTGEDVDAALAANGNPSITGNANDDKVLFDAAMKAVIESGKFTTADYIELCKKLNVETLEDLVGRIIKIAIQEADKEQTPENRDVRFTVDTVYIRVIVDGAFATVEIPY